MSEISKYEAYKKKLDGICNENNLVFRFVNNTYPITLTIRPVSGLGEQMSLLESAEDDYISPMPASYSASLTVQCSTRPMAVSP